MDGILIGGAVLAGAYVLIKAFPNLPEDFGNAAGDAAVTLGGAARDAYGAGIDAGVDAVAFPVNDLVNQTKESLGMPTSISDPRVNYAFLLNPFIAPFYLANRELQGQHLEITGDGLQWAGGAVQEQGSGGGGFR